MHSRFIISIFPKVQLLKLPLPFNNSVKVISNCRFFHTSENKCHPKPLSASRPAVYVTRKLKPEVIEVLSEVCDVTSWPGTDPVPRYELLKNVLNKDGILCMLTDQIDAEVLEKANTLRVVATMSMGYGHLDLKGMKRKNVRVGYTPELLTNAAAEFTMAVLLATSRRIFEANAAARTGGWQAWSPYWMTGPGLENSTVGIVGFGRIGQEVARRVKPFRAKKIIYFSRSQKEAAENEIEAVRVTFDELLTESDFVIVCCALTPNTVHLFNEKAFKKMKKTAVFINTSRGAVVDQPALIKALQTGQIWGAGLDVMTPEPLPLDHPFFEMKNCVITPHMGSAAIQTRDAMALLCAKNIVAGLKGERMPSELVL